MKTILILIFINTTNGSKHTIEYPMKDFATCLQTKKEVGATTQLPREYVVKKFECLVGAE